ncbi:hypothetical protein RDWZM_001443 [Blomia tropicalis]|uniref:J domain-containing protein n=1 Tax=Blomia tropicalis TaxID=40697 RepID=A0A9Q0MD31_BLOTA|nr:hypothetical protein RDWZM_001443 [Blomia tropicalis]
MSYLSECEAFKILGLPSDSNFNVVKKRFNELALIHHPDKNQNQGACEKFSKIYKAYNVLKNLHYDGNTTKENFQSPPNIFDLMLTLEEIFNGVVKYKEIKRKLIDKYESIVLEVEVIPGTLTGTNIVLPNKGDILSENGVAANVIFIVKEFKHDKFTRERFNLIHKLEINVMNAFRIDQPLIIPTIDGDTIEIEMDQIIVSTTEKKIPNRGLPYPKDPNGKRGSMIVRFDIKYDQSKIKLPTNRYELELSLKELFTGCKQTLPVVRKKLDGTFETIQKEVDVEAGTLNGTIIYFENEGDQEEGSLPADLEFVIVQIEDPIYKVRDFDLEISSSIDEQQAKNGCELNVPTIEGTEISVYFEPGVTTGTTKRIPNYGLLKPDKTRGDLVIRVDTIVKLNKDKPIIRPLSLTLEQILTGWIQKVKINRKVYNFRKDCSELKCEFATIIIPPGAPDKYEFVLENFADESKGSMPGDLIYVVQEKPHDIFKRDGANLLYRKKIYECLLCRPISIPRLGKNEPIVFLIDDDFNRKKPIEIFVGFGLPIMNEEAKNGDLIVLLDIMPDPSSPEYPLWLSLEEVLNGVENKQIEQVERLFINVDESQEKRKETVNVSIEPGIENGTIITIPWAEEENGSFVAFDINLKVQDKPHPIFERSGADIIYKMKVSQSECNQVSLEFDIPTLDGKLRSETFTKICKTNSIKRIANAGLPKPGSKQLGDLIVKFDIVSNKMKDDPIIHKVSIPLEDFVCGTKKRMKINRLIRSIDGKMQSQEKIIKLDILPGHKPGHEFKFIRMGDEHKGRIPADVIFKVFAKPHEHFKVNGYNLFYSHKVNRSEIDKGNYTFMVPTLDGDPIEQTIPSRLRNKTIKINGYGLPKMSFKSSIRGDIVVNLDINEDSVSPIENEKESVDKVSNSTKPPIIINLPVSIEHVMTGISIEKEFVQEIMDENGQIINKNSKLYTIEIQPGCLANTKYYFTKMKVIVMEMNHQI